MKARPILFSRPMIRAMLDGRKTQTRRIVKARHFREDHGEDSAGQCIGTGWFPELRLCPYGKPGDLLWVREGFAASWDTDTGKRSCVMWYRADFDDPWWLDARWEPSIHMPRWASRLTLRITDVRVEELQDISEEDARWESIGLRTADDFDGDRLAMTRAVCRSRRDGFAMLWDSINGPGSWDSNPWVWALTFEPIRANVDEVLRRKMPEVAG